MIENYLLFLVTSYQSFFALIFICIFSSFNHILPLINFFLRINLAISEIFIIIYSNFYTFFLTLIFMYPQFTQSFLIILYQVSVFLDFYFRIQIFINQFITAIIYLSSHNYMRPIPMNYSPHFTPVTVMSAKTPQAKLYNGFSQFQNSQTITQATEDSSRRVKTYGKVGEQKKDLPQFLTNKKNNKIERPNFPTSVKQSQSYLNNDLSIQNPQDQQQHLARLYSSPGLRTTCPNIIKKYQQNIQSTQNNLRMTSLYSQGSRIQSTIGLEDASQKNMKKNGVNDQTVAAFQGNDAQTRINDLKKPLQKPNYRTLNQYLEKKTTNGSKSKKNIINGFQVCKQLGKGKFGQVYLSRHVETGFIVALKKIIKAKVTEYKMLEQFKRQIRLHSSLDHPNIVKFYGFFEDTQNIYLILEYISGGTLFDYLSEKDMLSAKQAASYLRDTIEALSYLHEKSIAHRDIKPENIVLTSEKVAKLCDFGWSALVETSRTTYCGTFDYAPPQILQRKNYDTAVDIWCIGVLTFQLLTGRVPFEGQKRKQIMQKIVNVDTKKINYPVEIPDEAKKFIELLVQKDPNLRPKCNQLLKHPFFKYLGQDVRRK